jgi:mRNA interferase RelE/StbE
MSYELVFKDEVKQDLIELSHSQRLLVFKQFSKLENSPELGKRLGNKAGYNLSGCRKIYVDKKKIRIVYRIIDDEIVVEVIVVGKRSDMKVYADASERLS